jgi:hypothetical protein
MTPRSTHLLSEIETPLEKHEAEQTTPKTEKPAVRADPVALLQQLYDSGQGLSAEVAHAYLAEVREDRALSGLRLV